MPPINPPERPSPFTIPEPTLRFAEGPPAEAPPRRSTTVGGLIYNLTVFADFYERASADIDRAEPIEKPWHIGNRDANADWMQREFRATVAVERVRAYVLARYGEDLTIGAARRLLGDLIRACALTVEAAEALPLETAMDRLESAVEDETVGPAGPAPGPRAVRQSAGINARMLETIQANTEAMGWASKQWAEHLKCAKSSVVATETWKDLSMRRDRERAERAQDRRRRRKGNHQRRD